MMGGIIVGTLLTLLFLPALYVAWFRIHPVQDDFRPMSETVEPAHETHSSNPTLAPSAPVPVLETQI
jgi:multidrug efflux pump